MSFVQPGDWGGGNWSVHWGTERTEELPGQDPSWSALYGSLEPGPRASQSGAPGPQTLRSSEAAAPSPRGWGLRPTASSLVSQSCYATTSHGVVFALIVPGAVFVYEAHRQQGNSRERSGTFRSQLIPAAAPLPGLGGDGGQKEPKVSATPGSPQPSPGVLLATGSPARCGSRGNKQKR